MQLLQTLALFGAAIAALTPMAASQDIAFVEPQDVQITMTHTAIAATSLTDKRNYVSEYTQPICMTQVTRVREVMYNGTRDMYLEVQGCGVTKPQGVCRKPVKCTLVLFEIHIIGPQTTPGFDPVATLAKGKPVKTPYAIQSIGLLL